MAYPQVRDLVPDFILESSENKSIRLSDFRGRRDLILVFLEKHNERSAAPLLQVLSAKKDELESEETVVLVLVRGDVAHARTVKASQKIPFPVLADADGAVHERYGALIVLTDRYGEIYSVHRDQWPSAEEVMASVCHINAECPE
jgi:peroxiredoxin